MMQRQPARSLERSWQRYKQIRTIAWPRQHERPRKHILSPQSINFAPSVNLGRRTSHSPARSLFNDIWAIFLSCFWDFSDFSYFFHGLFRILGWVGELFCGFQRFQLLFYGFFRLFRCGLGSCFVDFSGFSYFFPEFFQFLGWIGELF